MAALAGRARALRETRRASHAPPIVGLGPPRRVRRELSDTAAAPAEAPPDELAREVWVARTERTRSGEREHVPALLEGACVTTTLAGPARATRPRARTRCARSRTRSSNAIGPTRASPRTATRSRLACPRRAIASSPASDRARSRRAARGSRAARPTLDPRRGDTAPASHEPRDARSARPGAGSPRRGAPSACPCGRRTGAR